MTDNTGETTGDVAAQNESNQGDQEDKLLGGLSELDVLKTRAGMMGITFSNNIGVDALKKKIDDKMAGVTENADSQGDGFEKRDDLGEDMQPSALDTQVNPLTSTVTEAEKQGRPPTLREWLYAENMKLIRCRITNLSPNKKDLPGEVITVANEYLGTVRKFIPYGEATDEGYHIPKILYEELKQRRFLHITTKRDRMTGTQIVSQRWAPEFSLEVMEPLSQEELTNLGQAQIAAGSVPAAGDAA